MSIEKVRVGKTEILMGEFTIGEDTDVGDTFSKLWKNVRKQETNCIKKLYCGVDLCRNSLIELFKSEQDFILSSRYKKAAFLNALNAALKSAVLEEEFHVANGISFFILWTVSVIQEDVDAKLLIEKDFAELRHEYDF